METSGMLSVVGLNLGTLILFKT